MILPLQHKYITKELFTKVLNIRTIVKRRKQEIMRNAKSNWWLQLHIKWEFLFIYKVNEIHYKTVNWMEQLYKGKQKTF